MLSFLCPWLRLVPLFALCLGALILFGPAAPHCAAATTYFVSPTGSDTNPGTLAAPFLTIQQGINTAVSGDTVTVEDGAYTGPGDVDLDFGGRNITVTSQNGAAKTIIDCGGSSSANHRGFYLHSGETNAVISGLTIKNGYESLLGGGISNGSILAVANCFITANTAGYGGGGVCNFSTMTLTNCVFTSNAANLRGGGLYNFYGGALTMTNCTVTGNSSAGNSSGGGIAADIGGVTLVNDIFYGDTGGEVGLGNAVANYCDIQGGYSGGSVSFGNIDADPALVNSPTDLHLKSTSPCLGAGKYGSGPPTDITGAIRPNPPSIGAYEAAVPVPGSDDFFVVTSESSGSNTIGEYTPTGSYVRTITVPANTTAANSGVGILRGIAATDAGQLVGFNGTFGPQLTTYNPTALSFSSQTAPGWEIANDGSSGSVGVYQGYTFVVNEGPDLDLPHTAIIRFNPDGTSQQFADTNGYYTTYINLAVGMDGKLYALRLNLTGSQTSAWALDVYDPISLTLLRTINLQLPYTQNSQAVTLRNFTVDAQGGIYAIELYNYVYHFDTNGNLLQSASHGQGGYTTDIKIDPVTGNLLIGIDKYGGKIIKTDPLLSSFQTLVTLDPNQTAECFIAFSNAALAATLIGPPALTATAGVGGISLHWTAPAGASGATYSLYRGTTPGGETLYQSGIASTTYNDTAVTAGTQYYYMVQAATDTQTSPLSNEASAIPISPPPAAPTNLQAVAGNAQVTLTWTAPTGPVTSYTLYRGTNATGLTALKTGITATTFTNVSLKNGTTYYYAIAAVNSAGTGVKSGTVSATPTGVPAAPTNLQAAAGNTQVTLTWTAPGGTVTSYTLYRGTSASSLTALKSGITATTFTNVSLKNGTTYYYAVAAVNSAGTGAKSSTVVATPTATALPGAPTNLQAVVGTLQATLTWTAPAGTVTSYTLYRGTSATSLTVLKTGITATTFTNVSLKHGTTYYYTVSAVNSAGTGPASNEVSATP